MNSNEDLITYTGTSEEFEILMQRLTDIFDTLNNILHFVYVAGYVFLPLIIIIIALWWFFKQFMTRFY